MYIIAEAAQGYEGSVEISKLLIRSAKMAGADAIKFQVVYADDLAEKGYQYYDLFKSLEMSVDAWREIRDYAEHKKIDFIIDIFGEKSCVLAFAVNPDGIKIHSTNFFDDQLIQKALEIKGDVYFSIGGIYDEEILSLVQKYDLNKKENIHILYGFQSEPTPIESNNLLRIPKLRDYTGVKSIAFMDHSHGSGSHTITLSALALGLGVNIFEKHITLDRHLEMEDYTSALGVSDFATYVSALKELSLALGSSDLTLTSEEESYRNRALKRVVAVRDLQKGDPIDLKDIRMNRPKVAEGYFKIDDILGKSLKDDIRAGEALTERHFSK